MVLCAWHTHTSVMSHVWMSHVTHMNASCHTYDWVVSHIWMRHVTQKNTSRHTYEWVMSHMPTASPVSGLIMLPKAVMSHVTLLNKSCHIYEWGTSHAWMSHVSHMNESCHACQTASPVWELITPPKAAMSHISMSHVTQKNESCHTYEWVMSHFNSEPSVRADTGWRTLIGSPKLQIIFHKRATKYRSLLRKMTYKDKGSYESSPPCRHDIYG